MRCAPTGPVLFALLLALLALPIRAGEHYGEELPWRPEAYKTLFTEAERAEPYVYGKSFTFYDWPMLDGQWLGIVAAEDGNVYFSISSHAKLRHAHVFRYLGAEDRVQHLANLGHACGELPTVTAPQDKIHSDMFDAGEVVYAATCDGPHYDDLPYEGGHWIEIDKATGKVRSLGKTESGDGIITVGYDENSGILYGMTNIKGRLLRFDPATGEERDLGFPHQGSGKKKYARNLTLMIAPDGRVYGPRPPRLSFWEYNPETDAIRVLQPEVPAPETYDPEDKRDVKDWKMSAAHLTLWNEEDQCFYFVRSFDEMLGRFYPPEGDGEGRVEMLQRLRPPGMPVRYNARPASCVLAIHDRTVWYTPSTGWGGVAHLVSYHIDREEWIHHGPIIVEGGRRTGEIHSLDTGADGRIYLVAFVYSIEGVDTVRRYAMRDKFPFHPRFVIIDPAHSLKPGTGVRPPPAREQ
jgi:hypothetical protein